MTDDPTDTLTNNLAAYVTNDSWLRVTGRPDAIDEIADQFERPAPQGSAAFWTPGVVTAWPLSSRGWHSMSRMRTCPAERRAAG